MPPTIFQRKIFWAAITTLSFVAIAVVIFKAGALLIYAMGYLQPVLTPVAIAAILAYLLEPVVNWLERRKVHRTLAVVIVFIAILAAGAGIILWILPDASRQGRSFVENLPTYTQKVQNLSTATINRVKSLSELPMFQKPADPEAQVDPVSTYLISTINQGLAWLQNKLPDIGVSMVHFAQRGAFGFLGVFGFLLSLILVPIFLFFFLKEGPAIARNWSRYLPLRASPLKNEIVSLLNEINDYLINFFRGQLIVSLIDGFLIGMSLLIFIRLDFALLIGLLVGVLGLIPYAGMMICWVPAVLIAAAQYGDWWHPMWVTIIFIVANQIDGMIIAPKIVGESVGLHPLTVIISVLAWSLILGGLLGALLAVPLTATLKVLLKRYFWDRPASMPADT